MSANLPLRWLDKANEDLVVARLVLNEQHPAHACFLSQQCIEKALKAFLLANTNTYPRTHKLVDLLSQCKQVESEFDQFVPNCLVIDQYYIPTRYPDGIPGGTATGIPANTEAEEAIISADKILKFVTLSIRPETQ